MIRNRLVKPNCDTCNQCYKEGYADGQMDYACWYHERSNVIRKQIEVIKKEKRLMESVDIQYLLLALESVWKDPEELKKHMS